MSELSNLPNGLRVLLVEDEVLIAMLVEDLLVDHGYTVVGPFADLLSASEAARAHDYDFAIIDINLHGLVSFPVAEIVEDKALPFLLLSGYGQTAVPPDKAHWTVLGKPFDSKQLLAMIADKVGSR